MLDDVAKKAEESRQAANLLSEENDALKNSVAELEAVVEEERSSMAEIRRSLEDLESQYHDLESSSVEKLERIMTLESELKQTEELQAETAQKLSKALHSAKDLSEVRAQLKERDFSIEELMSGKQALESTCKDLKLRNTDLLDQISALERELQEAAESTTELEMNRELVEKMQNDLDSKDLELSEFKTKLQRQEIEADRVQKAHETLMKSLDKVSETLGTQIKDLQAKLDSAEDDVAAKTSEIELANSKIEANEQKLVLLQKEIQELQGELQTQRAESEKLLRQKVDECEAYDDRLIEADMEKKRLRAKNDALQRKLDKFMQQNTTDSDPHSASSNPSSKDLEPSRPTERAVEKRPSLNDARSEGAEVKEPSLDSISQPLGARRPLASATNLSSRPQAQQPSSTASEKPRPLGGLRLPPSLGAAREANRPILRSIRVRSHNPSILPTSGATESVDPAPQAPPILSLPSLHSSESTNSKKRPRDEADDPQRTDPEAIMVSGRSQPLRGMRRMLGPERSSGFTPVRSGQRQDTGSSQLGKQDPKLSLPFRPLDIRPPESRPTARVPFPSFKPKSPGDT
ncbi:hypothetical protein FRC03_005433 [Tulasnella sp. 419]|nr:hypothetical protein FRC03_005433 [Tulasnella sp. 419]